MARATPPFHPPARRGRMFELREGKQKRTVPGGEEPEVEDIPRWKRGARSFMFDILAAMIVLLILIAGLYTFTDNWPPLVVVQSGSMQHSDDRSYVGVIDTGDLVFVKKVMSGSDVTPYLEGKMEGYRTYDSYGDVIIFRPNGNEDRTPIIHRAVLYVEFNDTDLDWDNGSLGGFDIPLTGERNLKGRYVIEGYEWPENLRERGLEIDFGEILQKFFTYRTPPHGGFITKGDGNPGVDQTSDFYSNDPPWIEPIREEWVIGRSVGELPWFGIIKLHFEGNRNWPDNSMRNLIVAMVILIGTPFILDLTIHGFMRIRDAGKVAEEKTEPPRPPRRAPVPPPSRRGPQGPVRRLEARMKPPGRR